MWSPRISGGIDTSLVYSADRFEIVPDGDSDHHETNPQAHLVHLQFPTRDILEVPLFVRENSAKLVVLVNHWPSRRAGRYESEPYRISVANHCACIVQCHLKVPRTDLLALPDTPESLARLNKHWNRNARAPGHPRIAGAAQQTLEPKRARSRTPPNRWRGSTNTGTETRGRRGQSPSLATSGREPGEKVTL